MTRRNGHFIVETGNDLEKTHPVVKQETGEVYRQKLLDLVEEFDLTHNGDALLICPKDKAQSVKDIVDLLKETGMTAYI